jgi:glutathione S-transferase
MSLHLFLHPLSSFCHKALIAFYENDIPFTPRLLSPDEPATGAEFQKLWPTGKFPLLRDEARGRTVAETSVIIEYLQLFYPGKVQLIPTDPDLACEVRTWDRVFDAYIHVPMQKIVADALRPEGSRDPFGVQQAREQLLKGYAMVEAALGERSWIVGDSFTLADCAASPALFYADTIVPITTSKTVAYLNRLLSRPAYARALAEAEPFFPMYPLDPKPSRSLRAAVPA